MFPKPFSPYCQSTIQVGTHCLACPHYGAIPVMSRSSWGEGGMRLTICR